MQEYEAAEPGLLDMVAGQSGKDELVAYVKERRAVKRLGRRFGFTLTEELMKQMADKFGAGNVKIVRRSLR
jgi:hypothetical protein